MTTCTLLRWVLRSQTLYRSGPCYFSKSSGLYREECSKFFQVPKHVSLPLQRSSFSSPRAYMTTRNSLRLVLRAKPLYRGGLWNFSKSSSLSRRKSSEFFRVPKHTSCTPHRRGMNINMKMQRKSSCFKWKKEQTDWLSI